MNSKNLCMRCDRPLEEGNEVWLELSMTDGKYYRRYIPLGHDSQGCFAFGKDCAKKQIEEQKE